MYYEGLYASDKVMKDYVEFICSCVKESCGASVPKKDGFPMKGYYVPVKLKVKEKLTRSAEIQIEVLGFKKEFIFFMSRKKSPEQLLHELQDKINEATEEVIKEHKLDKDKIWNDHHPLKKLK